MQEKRIHVKGERSMRAYSHRISMNHPSFSLPTDSVQNLNFCHLASSIHTRETPSTALFAMDHHHHQHSQISLLSSQRRQTRRICHSGPLLFLAMLAMATVCIIPVYAFEKGLSLKRGNPIMSFDEDDDGSAKLNVLVVGDWGRKGAYNQSLVAQQMGVLGEKLNIDFVISTGDNFYSNGLTGVDDTAFNESFTNVYNASSLRKTWHIVLGNHDYRGNTLAQLDTRLRLRDPRWHCERSFTLSHAYTSAQGSRSLVDFFFIDTNPFVNEYWAPGGKHRYDWRGVLPRELYLSKQIQNLKNDLKNSKATWKIVVGHHPLRSVGKHGNTVELLRLIYPIIKENYVHLYINGHDHCLEHIEDEESEIHFLTSGAGSKAWRGLNQDSDLSGLKFFYDGQGFMSLSVAPLWINISFYDVFGNTIHQLEVSKMDTARGMK